MAKRSKAKAKARSAKSAGKKTAKKKTARKKTTKKTTRKTTTKKKTAKQKAGTTFGPPIDPCQAEEDAVAAADADVDEINEGLREPDLSAEHRRRLEQALTRATGRRKAADLKVTQCRAKHGGHPI